MPSDQVEQRRDGGNRFLRRKDLGAPLRLYIACAAVVARVLGLRGTVTELSRRFMISRTFVYALAATLRASAYPSFRVGTVEQTSIRCESPYHLMLSLRLEGRCSIEAIATIMGRLDAEFSSVGSISKYLHYFGSLVPNTLKTKRGETRIVVFLSDEIFSKRTPILVTVDSNSTAILRIELVDKRTADKWKEHWECLADNGYVAAYLVCDDGTSLSAARKEALAETFRQLDTYHGVAHQLGHLVKALERAAYEAIKAEYDQEKKLDSARSDEVIGRRIVEYGRSVAKAVEAIALYDNVNYLYWIMIGQLRIFGSNGTVRDRQEAEANMKIALELLETLGHRGISKTVKKIQRSIPDLFNYLDEAKTVIEELERLPIDQNVLRTLCLAWQWGKTMIKAKDSDKKRGFRAEEESLLELVKERLGEGYESLKLQVYECLDGIVQSSSLVECINSIIRPYLNSSRNQVSQEALNLVMFYHNHRRYRAGKRKGKTPMELLTGKKQEKDWIELLLDLVKEKDPSFSIRLAS